LVNAGVRRVRRGRGRRRACRDHGGDRRRAGRLLDPTDRAVRVPRRRGNAGGLSTFCGLHARTYGIAAQAFDISAYKIAADELVTGSKDREFNLLPFRIILPGRGGDGQLVGNLYVAGRCASMTHGAQSAARVTGPCFVMGEAAGTAASMALSAGVADDAIDVPALQKLQKRLENEGAYLGRVAPEEIL
jgi:hypothetical protein